MNPKNRYWHLVAVFGAILVIVLFGTFKAKPKPVPLDENHRPMLEAAKGMSREEAEKGCLDCHNPQDRPLPEKHPPKEQCLICHRLQL